MRLEVKKYLSDALDCACAIEQFTCGKNFADFQSDDISRSAVYYKFTIIGEALIQVRRLDPATFDRISESPKIVGFRNQVVHGYEKLEDNVAWQIIQDKLLILRRELEKMLTE